MSIEVIFPALLVPLFVMIMCNDDCHRMDANGVIKVGDFGFSEEIYASNYYRQKKSDTDVKLPVRWMAPESIKVGIFTEKSDVVSAVNTLLMNGVT